MVLSLAIGLAARFRVRRLRDGDGPKRGLGHVAPLFIGLAILIDHFVGVPLPGASMNPARSFGPALVSGDWTGDGLDWLAIYVAGPGIGAALAGVVYMLVFWDREDDA
ncbi:MAG: aquaporin [Chloroflexi bacterium]|nr:aquaporin [Chloroflexota bacterium]